MYIEWQDRDLEGTIFIEEDYYLSILRVDGNYLPVSFLPTILDYALPGWAVRFENAHLNEHKREWEVKRFEAPTAGKVWKAMRH